VVGELAARNKAESEWQGPAPGLQQAVWAGEGQEFTRQEAAEYISSLLEGLRVVAHGAQMPFLACLLNVALEEANNEKAGHR
jgi:hypothetical protein